MGMSEFFHIESECEKCKQKCHVSMQAKVPGSYMSNYKFGDRLSDEVLEAFEKAENEYYIEVLGTSKDKIEKPTYDLPSFTIVPDYTESHCKKCGRSDINRSIAVVIEKGFFTKVLFDGQREGSIMHRNCVFPGPVLDNDEMRSQLAKTVTEYCEGPSEEVEPTFCPYCSLPLPTPQAKQCFKCHMDWHDPDNVIRKQVDENKLANEPKDICDDPIDYGDDADEAIRRALGLE